MPVRAVADGRAIRSIALAPVSSSRGWTGAAGYVVELDSAAAGVIAGLTRAGVMFVTHDGALAASTLDSATTNALLAWLAGSDGGSADTAVREVATAGGLHLVATAPLGDAGRVLFSRSLAAELTVLPELRRGAALSGVGALVLVLTLGALLTALVARPVRQLAVAADRLGREDFDAPLPTSSVAEVARVTSAFERMRRALAARLAELGAANRELADRAARLAALQTELVQRDRLAASARLVAQLAHEIRNPVANLRNCLELLHRRLAHDREGREFASLAIDELLRMHELAERMLDLNRPRDPAVSTCDVAAVAAEVVRLAEVAADGPAVALEAEAGLLAAIPPDACKQVLLNLVQNAREAAAAGGGRVGIRARRAGAVAHVTVWDDGPGVAAEVLPRVFDPFFTTKAAVHGVGLGLFIAEGLVRSAGGRITAANRPGGGAEFRVELLAAEAR
jgi:signal transduction histidine kinase